MTTKTCTVCKIEKPLEKFDAKPTNRDGLTPRCKQCTSIYNAERYDPVRNRELKLASKYGITSEEFETQLRRQNGRCAVCKIILRIGIEDYRASDSAVVDHDHSKGFLRGILCNHCNRDLGRVGDDRETFEERFGDYLDYPTWQITGQLELDLFPDSVT
jgi:hypothetical protein